MTERNIEGLRRNARRRHQQAEQQADEGIRRLLQEGRPVNFNSVALRQRVKQLEAENRELKRQLEVVYGQLYEKQRV